MPVEHRTCHIAVILTDDFRTRSSLFIMLIPVNHQKGQGMTPITEFKLRRPIRVCFMIDSLQPAGTETQLLALIRHLDRSRVRPALCLLDGEGELSRSLEPADCPVFRLGVKRLTRPQTLAKASRLARFLRRERIDVLQVYFPDSTYFGVPVAFLARVPRIVCTRNNIGYWTTPMHRRLLRLCHRLSAGLVANCQACGQAVTDGEGLSPKRIAVLENGVDLSRFLPPLRWPHSGHGQARRIGITANLRPVKDLDVFVRAAGELAATYPQVSFHIAGEGELRPEYQSTFHQSDLGPLGQILAAQGILSDGVNNPIMRKYKQDQDAVETELAALRNKLRPQLKKDLLDKDKVDKQTEQARLKQRIAFLTSWAPAPDMFPETVKPDSIGVPSAPIIAGSV